MKASDPTPRPRHTVWVQDGPLVTPSLPGRGAKTMTVGAHHVAFLDLFEQRPLGESCRLRNFDQFLPSNMVEVHLMRLELLPTIEAGRLL